MEEIEEDEVWARYVESSLCRLNTARGHEAEADHIDECISPSNSAHLFGQIIYGKDVMEKT